MEWRDDLNSCTSEYVFKKVQEELTIDAIYMDAEEISYIFYPYSVDYNDDNGHEIRVSYQELLGRKTLAE